MSQLKGALVALVVVAVVMVCAVALFDALQKLRERLAEAEPPPRPKPSWCACGYLMFEHAAVRRLHLQGYPVGRGLPVVLQRGGGPESEATRADLPLQPGQHLNGDRNERVSLARARRRYRPQQQATQGLSHVRHHLRRQKRQLARDHRRGHLPGRLGLLRSGHSQR
jgi:hypothetical protein